MIDWTRVLKRLALRFEGDRADLLDDVGQDRIGAFEVPLYLLVFNHRALALVIAENESERVIVPPEIRGNIGCRGVAS